MKKHILMKVGLLNAQVCSEGTYDEALDWLQKSNPAGTVNNWQKDERKEVAPVKCADDSKRTHYIFEC